MIGEWGFLLEKQSVDDLSGVYAGELLVESLILEGELVMVDPELMEDRGVEITDVDGIVGDVVGEVIGFAVGLAAFNTASGHPHAEGTWVVVSAVVLPGQLALAVDGATEFSAPDDEGVIEHAALLEVLDEGPSWLVDVIALLFEVGGEIFVLVPATVKDLHELDAALHHAAGEYAGAGEGSWSACLRAIHVINGIRFLAEIAELRDGGLHAEGHLELVHAGLRLGIAHDVVSLLIERMEAIEHFAADLAVDPGGVLEVEDRVTFGAERDSGILPF